MEQHLIKLFFIVHAYVTVQYCFDTMYSVIRGGREEAWALMLS